jgi:uncharacterized membrane protein YkoI
MIKMPYVIVGVVIVLAIAVIGVVVFYHPGGNTPPASGTADSNNLSETGGMVTGLQAFSIADNSPDMKSWKAANKNVSIAQISSEFCGSGLSDEWSLTYASDTGEATVIVDYAKVSSFTTVSRPERLYPRNNVPMGSIIDSDRACDIALKALDNEGIGTMGEASARLTFSAAGDSMWDLSYQAGGQYCTYRIDAASGNIIKTSKYQG